MCWIGTGLGSAGVLVEVLVSSPPVLSHGIYSQTSQANQPHLSEQFAGGSVTDCSRLNLNRVPTDLVGRVLIDSQPVLPMGGQHSLSNSILLVGMGYVGLSVSWYVFGLTSFNWLCEGHSQTLAELFYCHCRFDFSEPGRSAAMAPVSAMLQGDLS